MECGVARLSKLGVAAVPGLSRASGGPCGQRVDAEVEERFESGPLVRESEYDHSNRCQGIPYF